MGITLKTHKILWGRSGNRCAICRNQLIIDETESDDESIIGDEAHIVSRKENGPRGYSALTSEQRDKYDNLILLCRNHHKTIDDQVHKYSVDELHKIKTKHENWVKKSLETEIDKTALTYANYLDELSQFLDIENWDAWTSHLLGSGQPCLYKSDLDRIRKISKFIITRFWPRKYQKLEDSIYNLKNVLNDLIVVFSIHASTEEHVEDEDHKIWTEKLYQNLKEWNDEKYIRLLDQFEYHVDLVEDLTLELTRAVNLLIARIREFVYPLYREEEGKVTVTAGPFADFGWKTYTLEYSKDEQELQYPYQGLRDFMTIRKDRDLNFGEGENYIPSYFPGNFDEYEPLE